MDLAEQFMTLVVALAAFGLYWAIFNWFFNGGTMSEENGLTIWKPQEGIHLTSKRCVKCGIHPHPSQMAAIFGIGWAHQTMCSGCRDKKEALVIMCHKLKDIPEKDIKPWYMTPAMRAFASKTYRDSPVMTKLYISDGERFWNWLNWGFNMTKVTGWQDFITAYPNWKVVAPEEKAKTYPDIKDYISC